MLVNSNGVLRCLWFIDNREIIYSIESACNENIQTRIQTSPDLSCNLFMNSILFISDQSPIKPAIAAACVKNLHSDSVQPIVAANLQTSHLAIYKAIFSGMGLHLTENILSVNDILPYSYDLIVFFANEPKKLIPALPGNPAVIYWNLPEPAISENNRLDPAKYLALRDQINKLVEDLIQQGFLTALIQARKNAELVMDNLYEGIIAHDLNRRIFFFNKAAEQITGYHRQEILGRDCHEVFPGRFCKNDCSFCDPQAETLLPEHPYPLIFNTKSGETRQLEMSIVSIKNFLGNQVGVVGSFRDVTREFELAARLGEIEQFAGIIGRDPKMQELYHTIQDLADSSASVLIQGDSGTGKELVASAIHHEGTRASHLFVPVNCGALPETLLETELFGHVKGAFTGAIRDKKGRFELADNGTIFLDEIGDITPAMQVKLLRVLQDGTFQRVGSEKTITVNVRVISATHKNLAEEIAAKRFREDLYYRLCVVPLHLPTLSERPTDIPLLSNHFLKRILAEENRSEVTITPETMDLLMTYDWPGNVRELQNVIRYLLVRCHGKLARPKHLPPNLVQMQSRTMRIVTHKKQRGKLNAESVTQAIKQMAIVPRLPDSLV